MRPLTGVLCSLLNRKGGPRQRTAESGLARRVALVRPAGGPKAVLVCRGREAAATRPL